MARLLWTQKQDIGPRPRVGHAMAYDAAHQGTLLFGGDSLQAQRFRDTWKWDGENWTQVADMGPSARTGHAMVYDAARQRAVLFGGDTGGTSAGDTWEWDGQSWTQVADTGPSVRDGHAMTYDGARGRTVLFGGGASGGVPKGDTWEWDGTDWVQTEDVGPAPRRAHAMAYDTLRARVVLFGGVGATSPAGLGDTWEWNGTTWTQVADFGPDPCAGAAMVFKATRIALYGGIASLATTGTPPVFGLTWEWDGQHWTARQDIGPGPRVGHAMGFDGARGRVVLFGGLPVPPSTPGASAQVFGDTWEEAEAATPAPPPGPGPGPQPTTSIPVDSITLTPSTVQPGQETVIEVTLVSPAPPEGAAASLSTGDVSQPFGSVLIAAGSTTGQVTLPVPADIGTQTPLPADIPIEATAGGVTEVATLHVIP